MIDAVGPVSVFIYTTNYGKTSSHINPVNPVLSTTPQGLFHQHVVNMPRNHVKTKPQPILQFIFGPDSDLINRVVIVFWIYWHGHV